MTPKLIYVAGPFRGPNGWEIERNVRRAEELGYDVFRAGGMPIIPHANTRHFHGQGTDQFWLDGTLELARRCDALILTPDWSNSVGARSERMTVLEMGKPVFHTVADLAAWVGR
jgi:hypothetical protein